MSDLRDSTPTATPPFNGPPDSPSSFPPRFNEFAGFRETFLHHFTDPTDRSTLEHLASIFFQYWLEYNGHMPDLPESYNRAELRSVAHDLRYLADFLTAVPGRSPEVFHLSAEDVPLAELALELAPQIAEIAESIEQAIALPPNPEDDKDFSVS